MADYTYEEKEDFEGKKVKVLGPTYDAGQARRQGDWTEKLQTERRPAGYLKSALRYWYSTDWFGSEKRKQEA